MQPGFCSNCGEPLATNATFCPNCGKKVEASQDQLATQLQPPPPPTALPPTARASAPPVGNLPPPYGTPASLGGAPTVQGAPPGADGYAAQYPAAPPAPPQGAFNQFGGAPPPAGPPPQQFGTPPSAYAPGPPPPVTPGGGVAPWAQPQKRQGRRNLLVIGLIVVILLAACGGGAYALLHRSTKGSTTGIGPPGTRKTSAPGATSTASSGNTPVSSGGTQTLNNINRTAVYGGVMITLVSATQTKSVPDDFKNFNPDQDDILKITANIDFEGNRYGGFFATHRLLGPDGKLIDRGLGHGNPKDEVPDTFGQPVQLPNSAFYFEVSNKSKITDWTLIVGEITEVRVELPLGGSYDPTIYQETPHTMGLNQPVTFNKGAITGVITKIVTIVWNPCGCQAPKGMRFLRVYFHVTNNTAGPAFVGDGNYPEYILIFPNGDRAQADTRYNAAINVTVNGQESKDVGYDSWVIPTTPAHYVMKFLNPDGSVVGTIDFGTI